MTPNVWFALPQAVADMLVIGSYIPFTLHNFIQADQSPEAIYTYGWAIFTLFHAHFTVIFHTISIWLTVVLAVWRYLSVRLVGTQFELFTISWHPFTPSQTSLNVKSICFCHTHSSPTTSKAWCSMEKAKWAIFCTYLIVPIFCVPVGESKMCLVGTSGTHLIYFLTALIAHF